MGSSDDVGTNFCNQVLSMALDIFWGYRNFQAEDASRNILPWGILIGGEELHNNHHAYATSARLSNKWYEFDIGWMYIQIPTRNDGTCKSQENCSKLRIDTGKTQCDLDTLQAVISHRYEVLAKYTKSLKATFANEIIHLKELQCNMVLITQH